MKNRKLILIFIAIGVSAAIIVGIVLQSLRNNVEVKQSEIDQVAQNTTDSVQTVTTEIAKTISEVEEPKDEPLNFVALPPKVFNNDAEATTEDIAGFDIQNLNKRFSLIQISEDFVGHKVYKRLQEIYPILEQDDTYFKDQSYYIINYDNGDVIRIGYGINDLFEEITINNQKYWMFLTTSFTGKSSLYTFDEKFEELTKYEIPKINMVNKITSVEDSITIVYQYDGPDDQEEFSETYKTSDLNVISKINTLDKISKVVVEPTDPPEADDENIDANI